MILHISDRHVGRMFRITANLEMETGDLEKISPAFQEAMREPLGDLVGTTGIAAYKEGCAGLQKVDLSRTPITLEDLTAGLVLETDDPWKIQQATAMLEFMLNKAARKLHKERLKERVSHPADRFKLKVSKSYE